MTSSLWYIGYCKKNPIGNKCVLHKETKKQNLKCYILLTTVRAWLIYFSRLLLETLLFGHNHELSKSSSILEKQFVHQHDEHSNDSIQGNVTMTDPSGAFYIPWWLF